MKNQQSILAIIVVFLILVTYGFTREAKQNEYQVNKICASDKVAYFASGCFWCVESIFESVEGVNEAISGYAGGFTKNPTYRSIGTGRTGHAEAVAVYYNPEIVTFKTLVDVFLDHMILLQRTVNTQIMEVSIDRLLFIKR